MLEKWDSTLIVQKSCPGHYSLLMLSSLSTQRYHCLNQDFFPMKCCPTEDVRMYFWLETKMQGKQPLSNSLQSYLFLVTKLSFGQTVVRFSLSHFESDLCMMTFTVSDQECFHQDFKTPQEILKSFLCKFTVEPLVMRCQ